MLFVDGNNPTMGSHGRSAGDGPRDHQNRGPSNNFINNYYLVNNVDQSTTNNMIINVDNGLPSAAATAVPAAGIGSRLFLLAPTDNSNNAVDSTPVSAISGSSGPRSILVLILSWKRQLFPVLPVSVYILQKWSWWNATLNPLSVFLLLRPGLQARNPSRR